MPATLTPQDRLAGLRVKGKDVKANVVRGVVGAPSLELSSTEVSQFTFTVADDGFELLRSGLFVKRAKVDYLDLDLEVATIETGGGSFDETVTIGARPRVVGKLRRKRGPLVRRNLSPTAFVRELVAAAGGKFVGEPSAKRSHIALAGKQDGEGPEDAWSAIGRLASELGYWAFEANGRVYFGRPRWLIKRGRDLEVRYPRARSRSELVPDEVPTCRTSIDAEDPATVEVLLPYSRKALYARPGQVLELTGVPSFRGRYIVTGVSVTLDDRSAVRVSATTPIDPEPAPPEVEGPGAGEGSSSGSSGGTVETGGSSSEGFAWPVSGPVTSGFGPRGSGYHYGIDIAVPDGRPCGATKGGTVTVVSFDSDGYGHWVELDHGGGYRSRYGHFTKATVRVGQRVERGQVIGYCDSTGNATGPHLHFEIRRSGSPIDPRSVLP